MGVGSVELSVITEIGKNETSVTLRGVVSHVITCTVFLQFPAITYIYSSKNSKQTTNVYVNDQNLSQNLYILHLCILQVSISTNNFV